MKKVISILLLCMSVGFAWSQEVHFKVQVSTDSLMMGNYTQVSFELENAKGKNFQAPNFEGFQIVGGPSQASSFSMINGAVSQSQSYTYYLEPLEIGNFYIEAASIETEDGFLETEPILILVVPNPESIQQKPAKKKRQDLDLFTPVPPAPPATPKKPRKKRRIYRI